MAFRSVGAGVHGSGTSAAVPVPSCQSGDVIVLGLYVENTNSNSLNFTPPTGMTLKSDTGTTLADSRGRILVFWKRVTATNDATDEADGTYDLSWTTSCNYEAVAVAYSGIIGTGDPFEGVAVGVSGNSTGTTVNTTAVTTSATDDLVSFASNHATNAGNWTPPTGFTERYDNNAAATAHLTAATKDSVAAGSQQHTFTLTGTTGSSYPRAWLGALTLSSTLTQSSDVAPSAAIATGGAAQGSVAVAPSTALATTGAAKGSPAVAPSVAVGTAGAAQGSVAVAPSVAIATDGSVVTPGSAAVSPAVAIATDGQTSASVAVAPSVAVDTTGGGVSPAPIAPSVAIATAGVTEGSPAVAPSVAIATVGAVLFSGSSDVAPSVAIATDGTLTEPPLATDTSNRYDGIDIDCEAALIWDPPVAARPTLLPAGEASLVVRVIDGVNAEGRFDEREVSRPRKRARILLGGQDVTWLEGDATPTPDIQKVIPLGHGPGTWAVPQFNGRAGDQLGVGTFKRMVEDKHLRVDLVDDDPTSETYGQVTDPRLWVGFLDVPGFTGRDLTWQLGGEAEGRAATVWHPRLKFKRAADAIVHFRNSIVGKLRLRMTRRTDIGINLPGRGEMYEDEYLQEQVAMAIDRDTGAQWTIMPTTGGSYEPAVKDHETIHWTVYLDDDLTKGDLNADTRINRVFAEAIAPDGHYIDFVMAPNLLRGSEPAYPFLDGRTFGVGTTDADTDTTDGITALVWRLTFVGRLHVLDVTDHTTYTNDVADAVEDVQEAAGLPQTGAVDVDTWAALFDNLVTGYSDEWAHIRPAVQRHNTDKWIRSGSGTILGRNPDYDEHVHLRDEFVSMSHAPSTRAVVRAARGELTPINQRDWIGQLTLLGGVIRGEHNPGDPITAADIEDPAVIQAGENVWVPNWDGGRLFQTSHNELTNNLRQSTLLVSTRGYDTPKAWEIWDRAKETRDSLQRGRGRVRATRVSQDGVSPWDRFSGQTDRRWDLAGAEWNEVVVPSGSAGTLNRVDIQLDDPREFAVLITTERVPLARLNWKASYPLNEPPSEPQHHRVTISGEPTGGTFKLQNDAADKTVAIAYNATASAVQAAIRGLGGDFSGVTVVKDSHGWSINMHGAVADLDASDNNLTGGHSPGIAVTSAGPADTGTRWDMSEDFAHWIKPYGALYSAGDWEQPCGYTPYVKTDHHGPTAQALTGHHVDDADASYDTGSGAKCRLFLYIYPEAPTVLPRQQVFRQQLEGV